MNAPDTFDTYADLSLDVDVEIDCRLLTVRQILDLAESSLLELSRPPGEGVALLVGGARIAKGEILAGDEFVGIRIGDLRDED